MAAIERIIWDKDGVALGAIIRRDNGTSFFVQRRSGVNPGHCRNEGINGRFLSEVPNGALQRAFS